MASASSSDKGVTGMLLGIVAKMYLQEKKIVLGGGELFHLSGGHQGVAKEV